MNKPGWRTRRRSRVSLVERAVPRLGRTSEPADDGKTKESLEAAVQTDDEIIATSSVNDASNIEVDAVTAEQNAVMTPPGGALTSPADHVSTADDEALEARAQLRDNLSDQADLEGSENEASDRVTAEELVGGAVEAAERPLDQPPHIGGLVDRLKEAEQRSASSPSDAARASDPAIDGNIVGPVIDIGAAPPAMSLPVKVRRDLDWDRLMTEGFSDPRNGDRLLSSNMKEIVRALIRQAMSDQSSWRDRIILVTSPNERVAKTTASINFAFGLATAEDHQVILADVDTAGPGAVARLAVDAAGSKGIAEALADETVDIADLLVGTDLPRLTLVTSGEPDDQTFDRLASRRMLQILRFMTRNPKALLIIDAPPILSSQEAAVLSVVAGQVVLAVEAGRTTGDAIEHALQRLGERHNVSLVLIESSGVTDEPLASAGSEMHYSGDHMAGPRPSETRRRPAKAAVAAVALLFGLIAHQSFDPSGPIVALPIQKIPILAERWSPELLSFGIPPQRIGR